MANITLTRAFCVVVLMLLASVWARDVPGKYIDYGQIRGSSPSCGGDLKTCLPQKPAANSVINILYERDRLDSCWIEDEGLAKREMSGEGAGDDALCCKTNEDSVG
ncbi:hypothetical protein GOBAR_DD01591 [Gossypium barbadense]|nr:hypothetical protein GOBAR_DD01591 [Gossypium barbadense]